MSHISVKLAQASNIAQAFIGMRNPLESWSASDTVVTCYDPREKQEKVVKLSELKGEMAPIIIDIEIGPKDLELALRLIKAGPDHCKFMRQIEFIAQISAPMTWWWDFDTYKVATTKNSTSRMHKLGSRDLILRDFSWSSGAGEEPGIWERRRATLDSLNKRLAEWRELKEKAKQDKSLIQAAKKRWRDIIEDLPQGFLFTAMWSGSYMTLRNIYFAREGHKQLEFDILRELLEKLPASELITTRFN
jgi:hypothetical protein